MSPLFPTVGDKQPMILKWRILSATNDLDRVSAVALPKLPISLTNTDLKVANDTKFFPGLGKESVLLFGCCGVAAGAFGGSFCGRGYTGESFLPHLWLSSLRRSGFGFSRWQRPHRSSPVPADDGCLLWLFLPAPRGRADYQKAANCRSLSALQSHAALLDISGLGWH